MLSYVFRVISGFQRHYRQLGLATNRPFTDSVCFSVDPTGPASFWACMFAFSKIAELGDTLFLALRKRPVIFLHWYHHAVVLIYVWHSAYLKKSTFQQFFYESSPIERRGAP
ncbi:GNS1/SUR4 family protein [Oesophagostomum dentatum]|uniref:Elongation of very long chain fatty acids protein n=1 Tax=Oesophagostomum dentatum TaxID=61180 RepID=A0A0B1T2X1_OESDE|nr:GNS1/SUR4 family protein [Oesophagostomum dentatum]